MKYEYQQTLAGKTFDNADRNALVQKRKDKCGRIYAEMRDGSIVRVSPLKPWKGKSQRRAVIRDRRENKA